MLVLGWMLLAGAAWADPLGEAARRTSDDGLWWWYELPADRIPAAPVVEGALTWRYAGQARFEVDPTPAGPGWSRVPQQVRTRLDDDPAAYLGVGTQTRTDGDGRLWVLESVDVPAAYDAIDTYDAEVRSMFGLEPGIEDAPGVGVPEDAGRARYGVPNGWTHTDCDTTTSGYELVQWSGAMLGPITTAFNDRQRKIVLLLRYGNGALQSTCSGVMVDDRWLLTSAHCAASSTAVYAPSSFVACTYGNLQTGATCTGVVTSVVRNGRYTGDWEDDYAVLKLAAPTSGIGWFALSQASDSVLDDYDQYHRAYPFYRPDCSVNLSNDDALTVFDAYAGATMYMADGLITGASTGYLRFDLSSGLGMSGGPIFYCPNTGGCDNGHYVTAVESGHSMTWYGSTFLYGVKASAIRDWVIQYTP
jgi:hypothetical protein